MIRIRIRCIAWPWIPVADQFAETMEEAEQRAEKIRKFHRGVVEVEIESEPKKGGDAQ